MSDVTRAAVLSLLGLTASLLCAHRVMVRDYPSATFMALMAVWIFIGSWK